MVWRPIQPRLQNWIEIMMRNPLDDRNTHRIAKTKKSPIEWNAHNEFIRSHQPGAFPGSEQARRKFAAAGGDQNLPAAAPARSSQTPCDAVSPKLGH